jgi:hypothetical protein
VATKTGGVLLAILALLATIAPAGPAAPGEPPADASPVPACTAAAFPDVPADHPFCPEITWLVDAQIAAGYPDGRYRPTATLTRQALAAYLQRYLTDLAPPVPCTEPPFSDVPVDHPFCAEITWLADAGFAAGFPGDEFRPGAAVSRQALAAILSRVGNAGTDPAACTAAPFPDVATTHPFCADIAWLAGAGVIGGYPDGTFRPTAPVTRQTIAALLVRYDGEVVGDGFVDPTWWAGRQDDYLAFATTVPPGGSILNLIAHLEREDRDPTYEFDATGIGPDAYASSWNRIDNYLDTADFDLLYLTNLWYGYADELGAPLRERIEEALLDFKYWYTDPTPPDVIDERWYWSENHRIIFHVLEYLAGQAFPDETFTVTGMTGAQHQARAAAFIDEWLIEKARFGFSEWHSDVYYQKDVTPLLSLVEWADDEVLAERSAMILDLVMFDLATHTLDGNNGGTHGRSYMKDKSRAPDQDVFGIVKLAFDDSSEPYASKGDAGAGLLARAHRYRLPQVVLEAATSDEPMIDRERMGVPLDLETPPLPGLDPPPYGPLPEAPYGYDFDDPANIPFWWERGALTAWPVAPLTLDEISAYDLWETEAFAQFLELRDIVTDDEGNVDYEFAKGLAYGLRHMINIGLLDEVNTYTYRADDVMLSTAQDYRPGAFGNQYHIWQATLGARASVFTTHPANEPRAGTSWVDGDMYWTGTGSVPRSAQQGSAAIHVYSPAFTNPGPGVLEPFQFLDYTHAWFPTEEFDEVVRSGHWTFGRHGDGYVALWSWRAPDWRTHDPAVTFTNGLTEVFDLVAPGGPDNVWAVEVADAADWSGDFAAFRAAFEAASPVVTELPPTTAHPYGDFEVTWTSPSQGTLEFGTQGPLLVDGAEVALDGYPRYDNPWTEVPFDAAEVGVEAGRFRLDLDFTAWTRTASARPLD